MHSGFGPLNTSGHSILAQRNLMPLNNNNENREENKINQNSVCVILIVISLFVCGDILFISICISQL